MAVSMLDQHIRNFAELGNVPLKETEFSGTRNQQVASEPTANATEKMTISHATLMELTTRSADA